MQRQFFKGEFEASRSYSRAVKVTGGATIYLAGVGAPFDAEHRSLAGQFRAQVHGCFKSLQENLRHAGGALSDIVTMTVFITDSRLGSDFVEVRREYFADENFPASALITIESLAKPEMMIEIQAIAVVE